MAGKHPVLIKSVYDDNFLKVEAKCVKEGMSCSKVHISAIWTSSNHDLIAYYRTAFQSVILSLNS